VYILREYEIVTSTIEKMDPKNFCFVFILLLGLLLRLLVLYFYHAPAIDAKTYIWAGRMLFTTGHLPNYIDMPLYPILSYLTGGDWTQKLFDVILSIFTIGLIYKISFELFKNQNSALLAALIAAIFPFFIYYSVAQLTETRYTFLLCGAFYLFYKKHFIWGCIFFVLIILMRPTTDPLNPILVFCFALFTHKENWRKAIKRVFFYGIIYIFNDVAVVDI